MSRSRRRSMLPQHSNCRCVMVLPEKPKVWDITPPLGWNWTSDDWRMYNFFRDLDFRGGVLSGEHEDTFVLLQYNRNHPAKSRAVIERVSHDG